MIMTTLGEMDEALLQRHDLQIDNEDHRLDAVEYCVRDCQGQAHITGIAQGDGCFCERHIHRSVDLHVKRFPVECGGRAASLT